MKIEVNAKEFRRVSQMRAREAAKARVKAAQGPKIAARPFKPQIRDRDLGFLSWLHEGLPCIGCAILGPAPAEHAHIEAAHQKAQDAARGWNKRMGVRPSDSRSCPLCAYHHRLGPTCCDPAQAKFWAVLAVDPIAFCEDLFAAYQAGSDGSAIVAKYAEKSKTKEV